MPALASILWKVGCPLPSLNYFSLSTPSLLGQVQNSTRTSSKFRSMLRSTKSKAFLALQTVTALVSSQDVLVAQKGE